MNLSTLVGVQFWCYLAAATAAAFGPVVTCADGNGHENFDFQTVQQWKTVMGPASWWPAWKTLHGVPTTVNGKTVAAALPPTVPPGQSFDVFSGFFDAADRRRPAYKKTPAAGGPGSAGNASVPDGAAFGTEAACVAANDGRRPCVCRVTDLLIYIGKRLDETAADERTPAAFRCPSYKPVPASFAVNETAAASAQNGPANGPANGPGNTSAGVPVPRRADFDRVVDYELETSKDDHYAVHYGLVGSDVRLRCSINSDGNEIKTYKWDYARPKNKTKLTVTRTNTSDLFISGLKPRDSKNYTCSPGAGNAAGNSTHDKPYTHYVIAVEMPIYEIHGTAYYKAANSGGCTPDVIGRVRKILPDSIRSETCPDGSSRYACNVDVETAECLQEEAGTLEVKYSVALNENAGYLARIRTGSKAGRVNVLYHQKLFARISNVLVENLNKSLTVRITSQVSSIHTHFDPDYGRTRIDKYVSCPPGFGIREVFCAACPPHHYSPDRRADCLKCPKGWHQTNAGSLTCVKCPSIYSTGCYLTGVPYTVYYVFGFVILCVSLIVMVTCWCCCRDENESNIKILPREIRKKLNRTKKYKLPVNANESSTLSYKEKFKKLIKRRQKSKTQDSNPKIRFKNIRNEFDQDVQIP